MAEYAKPVENALDLFITTLPPVSGMDVVSDKWHISLVVRQLFIEVGC